MKAVYFFTVCVCSQFFNQKQAHRFNSQGSLAKGWSWIAYIKVSFQFTLSYISFSLFTLLPCCRLLILLFSYWITNTNWKVKWKFICFNLKFSSACKSVGENSDLCTSLECDNKKKKKKKRNKYLVPVILASIIAVFLPILIITLVIYKRRRQRGKYLMSSVSVSVHC